MQGRVADSERSCEAGTRQPPARFSDFPFAPSIRGLYCTYKEVSTTICMYLSPRAQKSYRRMSRVAASLDLQFFQDSGLGLGLGFELGFRI